MSAEDAVNRLMELHPKGFDLSLDRITGLLEKLGNPHLVIPPAFHVAGTNGKGSTTAFLRAILEAAGKTVHVHTSPHLVHWTERYRIGSPQGGQFVSDAELEQVIDEVAEANAGRKITVFEIMSAAGFVLFARHKADFTIMEVGLGGRFDATNVLTNPAACLITPVGLDHEAYLGDTLGKIAFEKAGIIKPGAPVIVGLQEEEALEVIEHRSAELGCPTIIARQDYDYHEHAGHFIYQDEAGLLDLPMPALAGDHQLANAAQAIAAVRQVLPGLEDDVFDGAMTRVSWPGRFERLPRGKLAGELSQNDHLDVWIDGGHNPHAGKALAAEIRKLQQRDPRPLTLIAGMLTTKEPHGFFRAFLGLADEVFILPVNDSDSGFDPSDLAKLVGDVGIPARAFATIGQALVSVAEKGQRQRVLICGSLYLIGEVLRLNETPPA